MRQWFSFHFDSSNVYTRRAAYIDDSWLKYYLNIHKCSIIQQISVLRSNASRLLRHRGCYMTQSLEISDVISELTPFANRSARMM